MNYSLNFKTVAVGTLVAAGGIITADLLINLTKWIYNGLKGNQ